MFKIIFATSLFLFPFNIEVVEAISGEAITAYIVTDISDKEGAF